VDDKKKKRLAKMLEENANDAEMFRLDTMRRGSLKFEFETIINAKTDDLLRPEMAAFLRARGEGYSSMASKILATGGDRGLAKRFLALSFLNGLLAETVTEADLSFLARFGFDLDRSVELTENLLRYWKILPVETKEVGQ